MSIKSSSASSADIQDDKHDATASSDVDTGDTRELASADGTEAENGASQVESQAETDLGTADAKPKDERAELLAVVKKAITPKKEGEDDPEGASSDAEGEDGKDKSKAEGEGKKAAADKDKDDTRFDKHPRWVELRNQVAEFKPKAEQWDKVQGFMQTHDLQPDEVAEGFKIMALMKRDPAKAYAALQPYMEKLGAFTGDAIPQDLQERIDAGEISENAAREMAAMRAGQAHTEHLTVRDQERERARQAEETNMRRVTAVNDWASSKRTSDADFAKYEPLVRDRARGMIADLTAAGQPPVTPEEAVKVVEAAYSDIRKELGIFRQPKPGVRHVPSSGSTSTSALTAPKSSLDAARQGLGKARARG